ncbi:lactate/ malate dehydrogenase [Achaetomium macrosporum]|uniref:Lactate/ malate dehydrogenase n=1 Tax=Achaetomium macrosporum TaxID=79813 RepID=A0AAN7CAJ2_9PEZI|nr:lactate/ malate dehydrogenase [Achaetomium macrosporum]
MASRIAIVGVGQVGAATAYALILGSVASELLLVDVKIELRDAQARDLSDVACSIHSSTRVRAGTHREAGQCDVVVITAGSRDLRGQTSTEHMYRNVSVLRSVVRGMVPFKSDAVVLVAADPVDVLTSIAQDLSGLPKYQVFGLGTFLDTVRLRNLVAGVAAGIAAESVNLSVVGVHGEPQVVAWSAATINGVPIDKFLQLDHAALEGECKHRTESLSQAKGVTPLGISAAVSSICSSILSDKGDVRTVSHYQPDLGCCFSMPAVLGRKGLLQIIQVPLDRNEEARLARSAKRLRDLIDRVEQNQEARRAPHEL